MINKRALQISFLLIVLIYLGVVINLLLASHTKTDNSEEYSEFRNNLIKEGIYLRHIDTGIIAIDPTSLGGTVTSPSKPNEPTEIVIGGTGFRYNDDNPFEPFVIAPDDGQPSMVLIFKEGSIEATLYIDNDAKKMLDETGNIEIITEGSSSPFIVKKSDIKETEEPGLYAIEVKSNTGKNDLKETFEELKNQNRVIYPEISNTGSTAKGSIITIKEPIKVNPLNSFNEFIIWTNIKLNMKLENDEKKILKEGIILTLEKTVDDATSPPQDKEIEPYDTLPEDVCIIY